MIIFSILYYLLIWLTIPGNFGLRLLGYSYPVQVLYVRLTIIAIPIAAGPPTITSPIHYLKAIPYTWHAILWLHTTFCGINDAITDFVNVWEQTHTSGAGSFQKLPPTRTERELFKKFIDHFGFHPCLVGFALTAIIVVTILGAELHRRRHALKQILEPPVSPLAFVGFLTVANVLLYLLPNAIDYVMCIPAAFGCLIAILTLDDLLDNQLIAYLGRAVGWLWASRASRWLRALQRWIFTPITVFCIFNLLLLVLSVAWELQKSQTPPA